MPFALRHDPELDLVEVSFTGTITGDDLRQATAQAIDAQKRSGMVRYLVSAFDWDLSASVVEIYELPTKQYWEADLDKRTRIAIVVPPSSRHGDALRFYEDACRNRGWNAQIHADRAAAIAWLRAK